jgi:alkanesulfonate monooxygenase SsuD/methylene tetrahydromethanopterin reductase-like flavin-dependent oxidoreductase (luciferase family)
MPTIKLGALCWSQYADWPSLLEAGRRADRLGYDSLWTWDHLYPIVGSIEGPILEGWTVATAWAQATSDVRIGLLVSANTFREPTLTAKVATTLDHVSGGRAILGIGAAWFQPEHEAFGLEFGDTPGERLRWLTEALPVIRGMLHGQRPTATGPRYTARAVRNDPAPLQAKLPILIGGGGERVTLRLVARYGDACNVGGDIETLRRKDQVLRQHCAEVGRDEREIERTAEAFVVVIRDAVRRGVHDEAGAGGQACARASRRASPGRRDPRWLAQTRSRNCARPWHPPRWSIPTSTFGPSNSCAASFAMGW